MKQSIFRQVALDRLSSPEQLDQAIEITNPRMWIALGACMMLMVSVGIWSVLGSIPTTASGLGVIIRQGGVLNIVSSGSGIVMKVLVQPGDKVKANEVIATVAQPALYSQLQLLENARDEAENARRQQLRIDDDEMALKRNANIRQHTNVEARISEIEAQETLLKKQVSVEKRLFNKGLVTDQQVLDLEQKLEDQRDQLAAAHAQVIQLDAERFAIEAAPKQKDSERMVEIAGLERQISVAQGNLELARNVVSPFDGEALEVMVAAGSQVAAGQPVISIQPNKAKLDVLLYVPSQQAKDVQVGMDAEISPSDVKREEYGFMRGRVDFVADYPATEAAIMRNLENEGLVHTVTSGGLVTEVHASIQRDQDTASGFAWSTSKGPDLPITSGTICHVDVVTRREKPIILILPFLKSTRLFTGK